MDVSEVYCVVPSYPYLLNTVKLLPCETEMYYIVGVDAIKLCRESGSIYIPDIPREPLGVLSFLPT